MSAVKFQRYFILCVVGIVLLSLHPGYAAGDIRRGKTVYERNCQGCHGRTGAGVGGGTPSLADPGRMSRLTDQELFETITKGRPGTGMPAWGTVLSEQDRWNVVLHLRTFPDNK